MRIATYWFCNSGSSWRNGSNRSGKYRRFCGWETDAYLPKSGGLREILMKKILIAPNSFKGALTAEEVAQAIETGLKASKIQAELIKFPIADGGDHTSYLLSKHLKGKMEKHIVKGVYLQDTEASYALLHEGKTAIIEVAETTGFKSISGKLRSPVESSSYGLGELIKYNLDQGVLDFIICLGGSASVDGGIGMLQALG